MIKQRRRRKILRFLTSETRFSMVFLSNLTPNPENFSAFGEIASLKKHYEKFPYKKTPPVFRSGGIQGGFLIAKFLLPQKCYFWTFQKTTTFWIFFIRFFSHDDFFIGMKQYYVYFSFGVSILIDFLFLL